MAKEGLTLCTGNRLTRTGVPVVDEGVGGRGGKEEGKETNRNGMG